MNCSVVAHDRTVLLDDSLTIREAINVLHDRGQTFSLRRTFQLYGMTYVEERSFVSKYRSVFGLSKEKTMYDIKLGELVQYKNTLLGLPSRYHNPVTHRG